MRVPSKPQGYSTVSPYLIVDGANRTIDFLVRVFGAVELRRFLDPTGRLLHGEVRIEDTVIMLADGGEGWPPIPAYAHIYVPNVNPPNELALEVGATAAKP